MGKRLTSRYVLVIHEVTTTSVKVWVGALLPSLGKPNNWQLIVRKIVTRAHRNNETGQEVKTVKHHGDNVWKKPFSALNKRFYSVETIQGLEPNQDYLIEFQVRSECNWTTLEVAFLTTLPTSLPKHPKKPFTIGVGSCFYTKHDAGRTGQAYEALYRNTKLKPHIKFLAGDQVYIDIGLGLYSLNKEDCQERIADDYAESWELLRSILRRGGTWMLADDHEYWNNYPYLTGFNPYLVTLGLNNEFKDNWESAAKIGVKVVQQTQTIRTFDIGNDISFCIADLRSERTDQGFVSDTSFKQLISWISTLTAPGVLVIAQPLIAEKGNDNDANLPDWAQYDILLKAIQNGKHDIVVLTGDVHYGRVSKVRVGSSNNHLIEVVTSPMSNLSELNGIAASAPKLPDKPFPFVNVIGMPKNKINFLGKVSTESEWWDLRFPVERTTEHFMTIDFYRVAEKTKMKINAWDVRNSDPKTGLPNKIKDFQIKPIVLN